MENYDISWTDKILIIKILEIKFKLTNKVKCKLVLEYQDVNLLENLMGIIPIAVLKQESTIVYMLQSCI
jgi:hypothetical protein